MADLAPEQRTQLDSLVEQMHSNKESDDYIQNVVNDFKAKHAAPFDVNKQNATMRANMAAQPPGTGEQGLLADFATSGPMGNMNEAIGAAQRGEPAKAFHQFATGAGKIIAPAAIPALAAAGPVTAGGALVGGVAGDFLAHKVTEAAGASPDVQDVAGDIGGLAGGAALANGASKLPVEPIMRFATNAVTKAPGSGAIMRLVGHGANAAMDIGDEIAARARGPLSDLFKSGTTDPAALAARNAAAHTEASGIVNKTVEAQHAEANRTNKRLTEEAKLAAKKAEPAKTSAKPVDIADMIRQRLSGVAGQEANVPVPERGNPSPVGPAASGTEAINPQDVANSFAKNNGFPEPKPHTPVKVDPEFGKKVSDAFEEMHHDPQNPDVKRSYQALASEVEKQFEHITREGGLKVEPAPTGKDPYANSKEMRADIVNNQHLYYYPTDTGFGPAGAANEVANNPLLAKGKNGMPFNDMLRVVHDYLAHGVEGHGFGANGEENAFLTHLKMLSKDAGRALATETRGQNSFVNFGPHMRGEGGTLLKPGDAGYLNPMERPFAAQKTGLLPDEVLPESLRGGTSAKISANGGDTITLEHRSGQEGLTSLEPTKQGTGQAGAEKQRQSAFPEDYIPRSYSTIVGGKVEPRFSGSKVYTTEVPKSKVYDFREDPLHLLAEAKAQTEGQHGRLPSVAEKLAHDKGFTTVTFDGNTYQHTTPLPLKAGGATTGAAKFAFEWPGVGDQYEITTGPRTGSHVSAETLKELGIPVPAKPANVATNGSGAAGGGSLEEVNRAASNKKNGTRFAMHGPGGITEIADQAGAQDIKPGPKRALVRIDKSGAMTVETAGKGYTGVGAGNKATSMQTIAARVEKAPDAAAARKAAADIIERERGTRLSATDKKDMVARVMDIVAERRRAVNQ